MSTLGNLQRFNELLSSHDSAPLYTFLYSLTIEDLIVLFQEVGIEVTNSAELKKVLVSVASDDLVELRLSMRQPQPKLSIPLLQAQPVSRASPSRPKTASPEAYNTYVDKINMAATRAVKMPNRQEGVKLCKTLLARLDHLKLVKREPGGEYRRTEYVTAIELRLRRFLRDNEFESVAIIDEELAALA